MYTVSSQYAIRALLYLAMQKDLQLRRIEDVAESEKIPQAFLAKLVQRLVKKGLVQSTKGLNGGIKLRRSANEISLFMIADAIDDLSHASLECALGNQNCSDQNSCVLHDQWKALREKQIEFLKSITLSELVANKANVKRKKRR
jgi:Rrf2 family iron-sulfur cluster assembly transcriptional regulator